MGLQAHAQIDKTTKILIYKIIGLVGVIGAAIKLRFNDGETSPKKGCLPKE
jgi:hypothetical protein